MGIATRMGLLAVGVLLASPAWAQEKAEIKWAASFEDAKKQAKAEGKRLFVDFWRDN